MTPLRIVVRADDAGFAYKQALNADLSAHDRVATVVDLICAYEDSHARSLS